MLHRSLKRIFRKRCRIAENGEGDEEKANRGAE